MKPPSQLSDILFLEAETAWSSFQSAAENNGIKLWNDSQLTNAVKKVFAYSKFVSKNCIQNPFWLANLVESDDLYKRYSSEDYHHKLKNLLLQLKKPLDESQLLSVLRKNRMREVIRIAFRDLSGTVEAGAWA